MDTTGEKYIFVGVTFENYPKIYHYVCDFADIKLYETVIVPVGSDNEEKQAVVTEKLLCSEGDAPYPPSKAKKVIEKVDLEYMEPTAENLKKCLNKPVKLIFSNFYNLSGFIKLIAETQEGKTYLRLLHKDGEITVPVKNLKYISILP